MSTPHFVRIDRDDRRGGRHFIIHGEEPKLALELSPDPSAPDHIGAGIIRRVCVPNSWAGDYGRYAKLLAQAQAFFARSGQPTKSPRRI